MFRTHQNPELVSVRRPQVVDDKVFVPDVVGKINPVNVSIWNVGAEFQKLKVNINWLIFFVAILLYLWPHVGGHGASRYGLFYAVSLSP
jgi:hypothetical protein